MDSKLRAYNSDGQAIPETRESNILIDPPRSRSKGLARLTIGIEFRNLALVSCCHNKL